METLVVIQARSASTRLPGKARLPLAGRPMLAFLLERLHGVAGRLCLATTDRPEDAALADLATSQGVAVVRGEENDVLARYLRCLDAFPARIVVRVTGDNPLTCPGLVDEAARLVREGADYAGIPADAPKGLAVDAFSAAALRRVARDAGDPAEREHINLHVLLHPEDFRTASPGLAPAARRPDISLTVDTPEDYQRIRRFVEEVCAGEPPLTPLELVKTHDRAPVR
ncbi:MAG: NTP transferase domain-containing protein [Thermodesulfobacteriota bacterium]